MADAKYTEEQKVVLIKSLQATIDEHKKCIATAQELIRQITGISVAVIDKTGSRKQRDGGLDWFGKIRHVLEVSTKALTSREILDKIYEAYPEFEKDVTHMASLSSALRTKHGTGEIRRYKQDGEFARFELSDNIVGFNSAVNQ